MQFRVTDLFRLFYLSHPFVFGSGLGPSMLNIVLCLNIVSCLNVVPVNCCLRQISYLITVSS